MGRRTIKSLIIILLCLTISSCGLLSGARDVSDAKDTVINQTNKKFNLDDWQKTTGFNTDPTETDTEINLDKPINPPSPLPARNETLKSLQTGNEYPSSLIYDQITIIVLESVDEKVKDKLNSNTTLSGWESFVLYLIAVAFVVGAVFAFIAKAYWTTAGCFIGALCMCIMPSMIEAIHQALQGIVWLFYGLLILLFIACASWVGWVVFKYIPKEKEKLQEGENNERDSS